MTKNSPYTKNATATLRSRGFLTSFPHHAAVMHFMLYPHNIIYIGLVGMLML